MKIIVSIDWPHDLGAPKRGGRRAAIDDDRLPPLRFEDYSPKIDMKPVSHNGLHFSSDIFLKFPYLVKACLAVPCARGYEQKK